MGEYADMAVDEAVDSWDGYLGPVKCWPAEGQRKREHPVNREAPKKCRRCGKGFLFWHRTPDGWRLHHYAMFGAMTEPAFVLHRCGYQSDGTRSSTPGTGGTVVVPPAGDE